MPLPADLSTFNPANADQLLQMLEGQVSQVSAQWWKANSGAVSGYLKSLAEAAIQTQIALAAGKISQADATDAMNMQKAALQQTVQFTEYMTVVLAQQVFDTVFSVIGWVIYNKTGMNLFPDLVQPAAGVGH
ncbi:MAG: hypothetical protein JSR45_18400 [Proteobacteria bacterium]|nr:hypothetical protein [Pseudomonadota bacterium]